MKIYLRTLVVLVTVLNLSACSNLAQRTIKYDKTKSVALNLISIPYEKRFSDLDAEAVDNKSFQLGALSSAAGFMSSTMGGVAGFVVGASAGFDYATESQVIAVMPLGMAENKDEARKILVDMFAKIYAEVSAKYDFLVPEKGVRHFKRGLLDNYDYYDSTYTNWFKNTPEPEYCRSKYCQIGFRTQVPSKAPDSSTFLKDTQNGYWLFSSFEYSIINYVGITFSSLSLANYQNEHDIQMWYERNKRLNQVVLDVSKLLPVWAYYYVSYKNSIYNRSYIAWQGKEYFFDKPKISSDIPET